MRIGLETGMFARIPEPVSHDRVLLTACAPEPVPLRLGGFA